jgi:hypothetical protein
MGEKLAPNELELYRRVDEVLHYIWDPIGIAGVPEARDEYYGYLAKVYSLLSGRADDEAIRAYLLNIERDRMSIAITDSSKARVERVVESIRGWQRCISEKSEGNNPSTVPQ